MGESEPLLPQVLMKHIFQLKELSFVSVRCILNGIITNIERQNIERYVEDINESVAPKIKNAIKMVKLVYLLVDKGDEATTTEIIIPTLVSGIQDCGQQALADDVKSDFEKESTARAKSLAKPQEDQQNVTHCEGHVSCDHCAATHYCRRIPVVWS